MLQSVLFLFEGKSYVLLAHPVYYDWQSSTVIIIIIVVIMASVCGDSFTTSSHPRATWTRV